MDNKRKRRILFLFIVPALVFYLVFWISPVLMSFFYGLTNWSGLGDYDFVGLDNFKFLIKEGTLFNSMRNTIIYAVIVVVWGNLQALALAYCFHIPRDYFVLLTGDYYDCTCKYNPTLRYTHDEKRSVKTIFPTPFNSYIQLSYPILQFTLHPLLDNRSLSYPVVCIVPI